MFKLLFNDIFIFTFSAQFNIFWSNHANTCYNNKTASNQLRQMQEELIKLSIKKFTGAVLQIPVSRRDPISVLMNKISDHQEGYPLQSQRLIYNSRQLEPQRLVQDYELQNNSVIHLVFRLRGDIGQFQNEADEFSERIFERSQTFQKDEFDNLGSYYGGDINEDFELTFINIHSLYLKNLIQYANQMYQKVVGECNIHGHPEDLKIKLEQNDLKTMISHQIYAQLVQIFKEEINQILLRRCSEKGKLMNFHVDKFSFKTLQLSLNDQEQYEGGRLVYVCRRKIICPSRKAGTVTIHNNKIVHGVTRLFSGVRYSLFLLKK